MERARAVIDRFRRRPRLAVVLGGGGTRGAYEVGVIEALSESGVIPDVLVGTSVGAINAAYWAFHPEPGVGQALLEMWLAAKRSVVVPGRNLSLLRRLLRGENLVSERGLRQLVRRGVAPGTQVEQSRIPLVITATDSENGHPVRIRTGDLEAALLASAAVPGLFAPVSFEDRRLIDGGLVANCDLQAAVDEGATDILAVDLMGHGRIEGRDDILAAVERALGLSLARQTDLAVAAARREARVALLRLSPPAIPRFGRFEATRDLFELGRANALELLRSASPVLRLPLLRERGDPLLSVLADEDARDRLALDRQP
ncbi:MAG TPA: patatin-like phospholipase family protein [Candidatus Dormibacteraeota bacterium]